MTFCRRTRALASVLLCLASLFVTLDASGCPADEPKAGALPPPTVEKLAEGVWLHTSHKVVEPWGPVLSHGLIIETGGDRAVLVDTAWTDADTERVLALFHQATGKNPDRAILTHAHADKMGGVGALREAGITSYALDLSNADAPTRGLLPADVALASDAREHALPATTSAPREKADESGLVIYYPGPGHTRDNIVVYYPPARVLFGGCLVRPGDSRDLGNTADGDVARWAATLRNVAARFPDAKVVVPSHGAPGGGELLDHTIALAEAANKQSP